MNQEKIGKFIQNLRKEKSMTQQELAESLGVTDRSISNWENGKCMPDLSLFKPICDIFGITINDLMSGERIDKKDYQNKLEENIINTSIYNKDMFDRTGYIVYTCIGILLYTLSIIFWEMDNNLPTIICITSIIFINLGIFKLLKKEVSKSIGCIIITIFLMSIPIFILEPDSIATNNVPKIYYYKKNKDNITAYKTFSGIVYRCKDENYFFFASNNITNEEFKNIKDMCK